MDNTSALAHIRLATAEEIERIRDNSDLMPGHTMVYALDGLKGPDIAVVRNCYEVNPVHYAEGTNDMRRARYMWGLEERLLGAGIDRYYFQISAGDEFKQYRETVQKWGAEQVSPEPEIRFLKVIK